MNERSVLAGLSKILEADLDLSEDPFALRLVEDLELDSLRLMGLAIEVENRFRVNLDEADEAGIQTIGDLVEVVLSKQEPS